MQQTQQLLQQGKQTPFDKFASKKELERLKKEVDELLPYLSKHKIESLQKVIGKHFAKRFAGKLKNPRYGSINKGFEEEELVVFLNSITEEKFRLLFEFQGQLGLRIGEAIKVNMTDISFEKRELLIKTEKARTMNTLRIPSGLLLRLQEYMRVNTEQINKAQGYLFYTDPVKSHHSKRLYIDVNYARNRFRYYLSRCGFDKVYDTSEESVQGRRVRRLHRLTTHSLRHYAITHFARATNGNVVLTSKFARHSEIGTTQTYIYTDKNELYSQIEKAFS